MAALNSDSTQDSLIVRDQSGQAASFPQTGVIDWLSLAKTTVSSTVSVMARLSHAGIDPLTVTVGQAIASRFRLSRLGNHRLSNTIANLPCFAGLGETLWFGFGIQNIVRTLAATEEGISLVMLCASLNEVHPPELSARVLSCLIDLYGGPGANSLKPSLQQWMTMAKTCSGILSTTAFPQVAEWMVSLSGRNQFCGPLAYEPPGCRTPGHPKDTARALDVLARISNGSLKAAKIVGGAECGFIAAVAHWFFEIDVEFQSADGTVLQRRQLPQGNPFLLVVFDNKGQVQSQLNSVIASETYVIHKIEKNLFHGDGISDLDMSGRLSWETVLQVTFGNSFDRLIERAEDFASAIGSAARIFEGISRAESHRFITYDSLLNWCGYRDESYGRGYINAFADRFPELAGLRSQAECAMTENLKEAFAEYEVAYEKLMDVCDCFQCSEGRCHGRWFCLPILAEVIIRVAYYLTIVTTDVDIKLCRAGFEMEFFNHRAKTPRSIRSKEPAFKKTRKTKSLLERLTFNCIRRSVSWLFAGKAVIAPKPSPMAASMIGRGYPEPSPAPAFVAGGLVFYLNIPREVTDQPEEALRLRIVPGRIETGIGRSYLSLEDGDEGLSGTVSGPINISEPSLLQPSQRLGTGTSVTKPSMEAQIEESTDCLIMCYILTTHTGVCSLGPTHMTELITRGIGQVHCNRMKFKTCRPLARHLPPVSLLNGTGRVSNQQTDVIGDGITLRQAEDNVMPR